jgi:tripartite-type tricarboxylate transporter receptor subunit TctC
MLTRRKTLQFAASAFAMPFVSSAGWAQNYPDRPVRIVVPFAAGAADIHTRLFSQILQERLGQPFTVENRPGGSGNTGAAEVVRSAADGYSLLLITASHAINAALHEKLDYNLVSDLVPIASLFRSGYVMVVSPTLPVGSVADFIAYAKASSGKLMVGSLGIGTIGHLAAEMFKSTTGVDLAHVSYRSEVDALNDLASGKIQVQFGSSTSSIPLVRNGRLRIVAVASTARLPILPDVPTIAEYVPGYVVEAWIGFVAPKGVPTEVIALLNREINAGLARQEVKARYDELGLRVFSTTPNEFGEHIAVEVAKWTRVIKSAGIKAQ